MSELNFDRLKLLATARPLVELDAQENDRLFDVMHNVKIGLDELIIEWRKLTNLGSGKAQNEGHVRGWRSSSASRCAAGAGSDDHRYAMHAGGDQTLYPEWGKNEREISALVHRV